MNEDNNEKKICPVCGSDIDFFEESDGDHQFYIYRCSECEYFGQGIPASLI